MKNIYMAICLLAALTAYAHAESLYRWVDKDGKVHYGDRPTEDAIGAQQKKFSAPAATGDDELSYSMRKAKQDFPVTLYVAPDCGDLCIQARSFLNKRGIPYSEKSLATKEDIVAFKTKTGGNTIPALAVGKSVLSGFEAGLWNGELDIAAYPKTAPYRAATLASPAKPSVNTEATR
ncbi:MAG TPA: glutaredoxin family protein [Gallionellaceae bacterium]|nr:glutaredoxin family protein [Gallionellaceae bacterium]